MKVELGQHIGSFRLPSGEIASGVLSLERGDGPRVALNATTGLQDPKGGFSIPGPVAPFDSMTGWLRSNLDVQLGPGALNEWFPGQAVAGARWAVVGFDLDHAATGWTRVKVRLTGLDQMVKSRLGPRHLPLVDDGNGVYSVDALEEGNLESEFDGVRVVAGHDLVTQLGNPHAFILESIATVVFEAETPQPIRVWMDDWIHPLVTLVSLATSQHEHLTTVLLTNEGSTDAAGHARGYLFGDEISQEDVKSNLRMGRSGGWLRSLIRLDMAPPLAELIQASRSGITSESAMSLHSLSLDEELPAQVRLLMNIQALEALDTADHKMSEGLKYEERKERFKEIIEELKDANNDKAATFLKKKASARFGRPLSGRLHRLCSQLPNRETVTAKLNDDLDPVGSYLSDHGKSHDTPFVCLEAIRNLLSHGQDVPAIITQTALGAASRLLRLDLLRRLGLNEEQLDAANEAIA